MSYHMPFVPAHSVSPKEEKRKKTLVERKEQTTRKVHTMAKYPLRRRKKIQNEEERKKNQESIVFTEEGRGKGYTK
jgi:hypothetical protein